MLKEFKNVKQLEGDPKRRFFTDDNIDLYVWISDDSIPLGFQLCYGKKTKEKAFSFIDGSYSHRKVDSGELDPTENRTPVLIADGSLDKKAILADFEERSKEMDGSLRNYIIEKIIEYEEKKKS